jgi:hypothetical protein
VGVLRWRVDVGSTYSKSLSIVFFGGLPLLGIGSTNSNVFGPFFDWDDFEEFFPLFDFCEFFVVGRSERIFMSPSSPEDSRSKVISSSFEGVWLVRIFFLGMVCSSLSD